MTLYVLCMLFFPTTVYILHYVCQSNNFRALNNQHKSDFRFYAAVRHKKMDNKHLYDDLILYDTDVYRRPDSCRQQ